MSETLDQLEQKGWAAFEGQRFVEALALADQLVEACPDHPAYLQLRAVSLLFLGNYAEAHAQARAALALRPDAVPPWLVMAHSSRALGRLGEAQQAYERAIALSESPRLLVLEYADFLAYHRGPKPAEEWAAKAVKAFPQEPRAWCALGLAHMRQHRFPEARSALQRALELDAHCEEAQALMIDLLRATGQETTAAALVKVAEESPGLKTHIDAVKRNFKDRETFRKLLDRPAFMRGALGIPPRQGPGYYLPPILKFLGIGWVFTAVLFALGPLPAAVSAVSLLLIWWVRK